MAQNFPSNPVLGDQYQDYVFDGTSWKFAQTLPGGLPCGSVITWSGATAPPNWLLCDGTAVSRRTYASLFGVIGTTYGAGDGSTTFNLPDLRGRVPVGKNGGTFGSLGSTGGAETHTLTTAQMPSHNHGGSTSTTGAHSHSLNGKVNISQNGYGQNSPINGNAGNFADGSALSAGDHSHTISSQGGGAAHNNLQPYQVVNYIIKTTVAETPGESELAPRVGAVEASSSSQNTRLNSLETPTAIMSGQVGTTGSFSGPQKIPFDDIWVQRGITYDTGSRRFYVPISGVYRITMNPFTNPAGGALRAMIGINNDAPNSANHRGHCYKQNSEHDTLSLNSIVYLNSNDYIVFYLASGQIYNATGDRFNQFTIERIGS